ncbi:MAG: hypothetical protein RI575_10295 [Balneolaceae bacterium]|nr:hypothetical protein [Balneolaceae bacterium]MDR9408655.1 hypothetical protein [Balneolaceae bacterium]
MRRFKIIVLLILLSAYRSPVTQNVQDYGEEFELNFGEMTKVGPDKTLVEFLDVSEDSRCPINGTCVWAGNGKVQIRIDDREINLNTYLEPRDTIISNHLIKLISLKPYPEHPEQIDKKDYRVRLQIRNQ